MGWALTSLENSPLVKAGTVRFCYPLKLFFPKEGLYYEEILSGSFTDDHIYG
jgi:hypothetical protein